MTESGSLMDTGKVIAAGSNMITDGTVTRTGIVIGSTMTVTS